MKRSYKGYILYVAMFLILATIVSQLTRPSYTTKKEKIDSSTLLSYVKEDKIDRVVINADQKLFGLLRDSSLPADKFPKEGYDFEAVIDREGFLTSVRQIYAEKLGRPFEQVGQQDFTFTITYQQPVTDAWYMSLIPLAVMVLMVVVFWMFMMRQQGGGNSKVMNFGRSRARMFDPEKNKITFADVAGAVEEKEELAEIVDFLREPKRYTERGARIPKGVLLVGPPGTGKTLLAKAVAGEAKVSFLSISGSDFVEMFVGVGASRVRDLFEQAKRHSPSIVFIDEIDAVGRQRGAGLGGGHDEREQTLNQLLVEMDGFSNNEGVVVLAATNRHDILDPALLRPGRFDRQVMVGYPDVRGREAILQVHSKGKPLAPEVDLALIAKRTPFSTGADLENIMNEAAILCARNRAEQITMAMLQEAVERVEMGPEKRSHVVHAKDKKIVAYHEAGHALVGSMLEHCEKVQLVTIVPRGATGGHTLLLPEEERDFESSKQLHDNLAMTLGGYAAEKIVFGDMTGGATSDLRRATEVSRRMVTHFGMSEELGPIYLGGEHEVFLGRDFAQQSRTYSETMATKIDEEVHSYLQKAYTRAEKALRDNLEKLHAVADALMEKETIYRAEFEAILNQH